MAQYDEALDYYRQVTAVTDPGKYKRHLVDLPDDILALCRVVQGLVIHDMWVTQYGIELATDRLRELRLYYTVPYLVGRPWKPWEMVAKDDQAMTERELELLDYVASITQGGNEAFGEIRSVYEANPGLKPPAHWARDMQALWFE